jgi:hypothetical protein
MSVRMMSLERIYVTTYRPVEYEGKNESKDLIEMRVIMSEASVKPAPTYCSSCTYGKDFTGFTVRVWYLSRRKVMPEDGFNSL